MRLPVCGLMCGLFFVLAGCGSKDRDLGQSKNVFGTENRVDLDVSSYPGRALGRLDGGCSGALIGKDMAVTAAHCVYDTDTGELRRDIQFFRSGYRDGQVGQESWIQAVWFGTKTPVASRKDDWAILQLATPIGESTGWFGVAATNVTENLPATVHLAGYSSDYARGERAHQQKDCYIHKIDEQGRHLHDCDGGTGVSGAPIYSEDGSGAQIVALAVSEFRTGSVSMQRDAYSHDYANIAIAVDSVASTAGQLRRAFDSGQVPEQIPGVHNLVNLNAWSGGGDDERESGDQDNEEMRGPEIDDIRLRHILWDHSTRVINTSIYIHETARDVSRWARHYHHDDLHYKADQVVVSGVDLEMYATQFALETRSSKLRYRDVTAAMSALMVAENDLNQFIFSSTGSVWPSPTRDLVASIRSARYNLEEVFNAR